MMDMGAARMNKNAKDMEVMTKKMKKKGNTKRDKKSGKPKT